MFVPKSADAAENDGWVLALRYDRERDRSDLVILDAREFGGDPVAVVQLPRRVPRPSSQRNGRPRLQSATMTAGVSKKIA